MLVTGKDMLITTTWAFKLKVFNFTFFSEQIKIKLGNNNTLLEKTQL